MSKSLDAHQQAVNSHAADLIRGCQSVPLLDAYPAGGGLICLVLDGRLGLELTEADACAVIPFVAECIRAASRHPSRLS